MISLNQLQIEQKIKIADPYYLPGYKQNQRNRLLFKQFLKQPLKLEEGQEIPNIQNYQQQQQLKLNNDNINLYNVHSIFNFVLFPTLEYIGTKREQQLAVDKNLQYIQNLQQLNSDGITSGSPEPNGEQDNNKKIISPSIFVWYGKDDVNQLVRTVLKIVFSTPYLTFVGLITLLSPLRLEKIPFVNNLKESWYQNFFPAYIFVE
ncbi:hypothetical protein PPERSA_06323 [Pseudocohnilembus persalinus]|uniref:Uncharacterized protein n=1 Tax=Pseudocohnilembus persalinus TaxID=266149 RepID=A0A0V0QJG4_PSEPJ|nr:hypothetical protein PPERSA_06323 [Pseudocohnilembus persalinus]|eukprot:KRX02128.1 hypothetical protein PPERSA_06323 [Pseudocohnilembus persalinus]